MPDIIRSRHLELILMEPAFMEALLDRDIRRAEQIASLIIAPDLLIKPGTLSMRLQQIRDHPEVHPWLMRAIVIRASRVMCGYINFHSAPGPDDLQDIAPDGIELGYTIAASYRRQGLGKEAAIALMKWAFDQHGQRHFILSISPTNEPSLALARSMGFREIGSHIDDEDGLELCFERRLDRWPDDWEAIVGE